VCVDMKESIDEMRDLLAASLLREKEMFATEFMEIATHVHIPQTRVEWTVSERRRHFAGGKGAHAVQRPSNTKTKLTWQS
jgi:hypothetical protein